MEAERLLNYWYEAERQYFQLHRECKDEALDWAEEATAACKAFSAIPLAELPESCLWARGKATIPDLPPPSLLKAFQDFGLIPAVEGNHNLWVKPGRQWVWDGGNRCLDITEYFPSK